MMRLLQKYNLQEFLETWKLGMNDKAELFHYKTFTKWEPLNRISVANLVNIVCGNVPDIFMKCVQEPPDSYTCQISYQNIADINKYLIVLCTK